MWHEFNYLMTFDNLSKMVVAISLISRKFMLGLLKTFGRNVTVKSIVCMCGLERWVRKSRSEPKMNVLCVNYGRIIWMTHPHSTRYTTDTTPAQKKSYTERPNTLRSSWHPPIRGVSRVNLAGVSPGRVCAGWPEDVARSGWAPRRSRVEALQSLGLDRSNGSQAARSFVVPETLEPSVGPPHLVRTFTKGKTRRSMQVLPNRFTQGAALNQYVIKTDCKY